jgi:hypothetical protein
MKIMKKYVLSKVPSEPRRDDIEEVLHVARDDTRLILGCPVICSGLDISTKINDQVGYITGLHNEKTGKQLYGKSGMSSDVSEVTGILYEVHFEDTSLSSALVKPENLRIAFVLPNEDVV